MQIVPNKRASVCVVILFCLAATHVQFTTAVRGQAAGDPVRVTADFVGREVNRTDTIIFTINKDLNIDVGRIAVVVGNSDISALLFVQGETLSYRPIFQPLPTGKSPVIVFEVSPSNDWRPIGKFELNVRSNGSAENATSQTIEKTADRGQAKNPGTRKTVVEITPNISLNLKGQNQNLTFPRESVPERNPFTDLAGQGTLQVKVSRSGWVLQNQMSFAGSSFDREALRFGELGSKAPQIDLSSYLVEIGKGRFKFNMGHVSFGSNRHLINSFSSRGISVTIPIQRNDEISFTAMNGSSIVGYNNLLGVNRLEHSVAALRYAREFIPKRPNGLRFEVSLLRGSLLPLNNLNQGRVNDAESSVGFGFKVVGSSANSRLRYEAGFVRSRFFNPADPLLEQGTAVRPIAPRWRNARYAEVSYDIIQNQEIWRGKKLKLTGTYRHEEIQPLYRSIAVSTQADRRQNQFEVTASLGEINFVYSNFGDRDNLNNIRSILKTLTRRNNMSASIALNTFFDPAKPRKWLPQLSYTADHLHQFGAFLPVDGDFRDLSQVPDQQNLVQAVNAQWRLSDRFSFGLRHNRAFQDNRQPGRELADFRSYVNTATFGIKPHKTIDLDIDLTNEEQRNLEQPRTDRNFRLGGRVSWQTPFLKQSAFSGGFSGTIAGDRANTTDARNAEFDVQWAYRLSFGKEKFKKADAQFFIRYSNRYGNTIDRVSVINNFTKTQAFNFGLTLNVL